MYKIRSESGQPEADFDLPLMTGLLWIDAQALIAEEGQRLLATLNDGLASTEHQEFVTRLRETKHKPKA